MNMRGCPVHLPPTAAKQTAHSESSNHISPLQSRIAAQTTLDSIDWVRFVERRTPAEKLFERKIRRRTSEDRTLFHMGSINMATIDRELSRYRAVIGQKIISVVAARITRRPMARRHPKSWCSSTSAPPWPVMADDAYHGITGEVVKRIEPHSEGDPVALMLQFLTLAGNVIGRMPYYQAEFDQHHPNLFCVLVGASAKGRKGTSMGRIRAVASCG